MTLVYRVTVRGRFSGLSDSQRSWLKAKQAEHDVFVSSFTEEGSLSYEPAVEFFSFRCEVRFPTSGGEAEACVSAIASAERFLTVLQLPHTALRAAAMDMSAMVNSRTSLSDP